MDRTQVGEFVPHQTPFSEAQTTLSLTNEAQTQRQEFNRLLLDLIAEEIRRHPDTRFFQILSSMRIVDGKDRFYEEPWDTINRFHEAVRSDKWTPTQLDRLLSLLSERLDVYHGLKHLKIEESARKDVLAVLDEIQELRSQ
jgi:hypothetical protein